MSNIGITRSGLTTCKILFSALLLSAIVGGYNVANLASAQQVQQQGTVVGSENGTTTNESSTSLPSPQLLSQSQGQGQQSTNRTLSAPEIEPKLNEYFVWSGLVSSNIDGLPSPEEDAQSAVLLPLRGDDALYSGTLTFQSNSPVDVVVWNQVPPGNETVTPEDFGDTSDFGRIMNKTVIPIEIASGTSGSVPFVGNTLELIGDDEESFAATYAVNAIAEQPEVVSDLTSLGNFTTGEEGEEE